MPSSNVLSYKTELPNSSLKGIQGCSEFVQNFSERQILWSLCSVNVNTFTLQLPIQTLQSLSKFQQNEHTPA